VKNESLEVPSGVEGIVIDTRKFSRKTNLTPTEKKKIREESKEIEREAYKKMNDLIESANGELKDILGRSPVKGFEYGPRGSVKDLRSLKEKFDPAQMDIKGKKQVDSVQEVLRTLFGTIEQFENDKDKKINQLTRGEELPTGVLEKVKIYVATKRSLSVGDKVAGRHGNKGVVARILAEEDMPFLEDGTPVDIILNQIGRAHV
jgi:DNA-directed RNA polymerase subunit beta